MHNMTEEFYKLVDNGYIYEEDSDGYNMSYGEYADVSGMLWSVVESELSSCNSMEEAYDKWCDLVDSADDDTKMFWGLSEEEEYFEFWVDRDEGTYHVYGDCPWPLKRFLDDFKQEARIEGWRKE